MHHSLFPPPRLLLLHLPHFPRKSLLQLHCRHLHLQFRQLHLQFQQLQVLSLSRRHLLCPTVQRYATTEKHISSKLDNFQVGAEHWCNSCNPPFLLLSGRCVQGCPPEGYYEVGHLNLHVISFLSFLKYVLIRCIPFLLSSMSSRVICTVFVPCMKARFRVLVSDF